MSDSVARWRAADVASTFGLGEPVGEARFIARGAMGVLWRLNSASGSWAVKELFDPPEAEGLAPESRFVDAARDMGVASPPLVRAGDRLVVDMPTVDGAASPIRVYGWIDNVGSPKPPLPVERCREAGMLLGRLHRTGITVDREPDDWYMSRNVGGPWLERIDALEHRRPELVAMLRPVIDDLVSLDDLAAQAPRPPWMMCHRDFDPTNTLIDTNDRLVLVDWENAGSLTAEAELAYSLLGWCVDRHSEVVPAAVHSFLAGYADEGVVPAPRGLGSFSVALAARLNFLALMLARVVNDDVSREEQDRAERNAQEVIEGLPRAAMLRDTLDMWEQLL